MSEKYSWKENSVMQRSPAFVNRHVRNGAELEIDLGARARHALKPLGRYAVGQSRRHQIELENFRSLRGRHDARQIVRVSEEGKHLG